MNGTNIVGRLRTNKVAVLELALALFVRLLFGLMCSFMLVLGLNLLLVNILSVSLSDGAFAALYISLLVFLAILFALPPLFFKTNARRSMKLILKRAGSFDDFMVLALCRSPGELSKFKSDPQQHPRPSWKAQLKPLLSDWQGWLQLGGISTGLIGFWLTQESELSSYFFLLFVVSLFLPSFLSSYAKEKSRPEKDSQTR